jgi:serine protease
VPMVRANASNADTLPAGTSGTGIKIGVIDSGVFVGHEDLAGLPITGEPVLADANDQRNWNRDYLGHGTHVVGTILAAANNDKGVVGVSTGASIHMVKVFGDAGNWVYSSDLLSAARAAANKGCKIISMSLGGSRSSLTERNGMDDLYNKGVLLVAAAGNDGTTGVSYPAGYTSVISVAAIDQNKVVASFSQKNSDVELAAPGVGVLSTVPYIETNNVAVAGNSYGAEHIEFAARGNPTAPLVYGNLGTATNSAWSGKVVLVDRGTNSFYEKVRNVQLSGGVACIIANNVAAEPLYATLGDGNTSTIPAIGVTQADGATLKSFLGQSATVTSTVQQNVSNYEYYDGTSMATPHVSAVAALIWGQYPGATNAQVRSALTNSAEDLGAAGRDTSYGYGLVHASSALTLLAAVNPAPTPTPTPGSGDTTAPVISEVASSGNSKNGSFTITWKTNELATSDVIINGALYADATMATSHKRSFRGTKGAVYTYQVQSTDAAGNTATSATYSVTW